MIAILLKIQNQGIINKSFWNLNEISTSSTKIAVVLD